MGAVLEVPVELLERMEAKLDALTRRIESMTPEQPAMTVKAFAKRAGISTNTAFRRIAAGEVVKKNGKVPYSELRKFLS